MKSKALGYIYLIENDINDKLYVGQTTDLKTRVRKHFHNNRKDTAIGCSIRKYGPDHFDLVLIEACYSQQELDEREIFWIKQLNTRVSVGYNLTSGGFTNARHSSETIEKMRCSKQGSNNPMFGKKLSVEHRNKISRSMKARFALTPHHSIGTKHSEETKKQMSEIRKGDNHWLHKNPDAKLPFLGRKHSEETKKKMREARYRQLSKLSEES